MVDLRHPHELNGIRGGRYEVSDRLYDRCSWRCRHQTNLLPVSPCQTRKLDLAHLIALEFTCHYFSTLDDAFDIVRAVGAEGDVKCPWLTPPMQPSHDFVAGEQAQLLLQSKLNLRVNDFRNYGAQRVHLHRVP